MLPSRLSIVAILGVLLLLFFLAREYNQDKKYEQIKKTDSPSSVNPDFAVYDGMNLRDKPAAIAQAGVKPLDVHYAGPIFGTTARNLPGTMHLPNKDRVLELARESTASSANIGVIDIEHWPTKTKDVTLDKVQQSISNLYTVLEWFQEGAPDVEWGFYGEMPIRNYWDAIQPIYSEEYQNWMTANDRLRPLAKQVDVLFPSIYTFYNRPQEWVTYARAQIAEARRLNPEAKVIAYLWPVYHMSNKNGLAGQLIDAEFWRLQLETVHKHADGVAIYLSSSFNFDPADSWWQVTRDFIRELDSNSEPGT